MTAGSVLRRLACALKEGLFLSAKWRQLEMAMAELMMNIDNAANIPSALLCMQFLSHKKDLFLCMSKNQDQFKLSTALCRIVIQSCSYFKCATEDRQILFKNVPSARRSGGRLAERVEKRLTRCIRKGQKKESCGYTGQKIKCFFKMPPDHVVRRVWQDTRCKKRERYQETTLDEPQKSKHTRTLSVVGEFWLG